MVRRGRAPRGEAGARRRLPSRIRRYRDLHRIRRRKYAKFYGRYRTTTGKTKGFGFHVKASDRLRPQALGRLVTHTINKMLLEKALPVHRKGETFPKFLTLFHSRWVRIRKVLDYDVDVTYD